MQMVRFIPWTLGFMACATPELTAPPEAPVESAAQFQTTTLGGMTARVVVGAGQPPDANGRPALIVLHGCAQSAQDIINGTDLEAVADDFDAVVVVPSVPNGGVYFGCWDYYGGSHSRFSGHSGALLDLVDDLLASPTYDVSPDRVWISGLSSGGGMAAIMGCLAPDVFSGVGVSAGPAVGTSASQISTVSTSAAQAANTCDNLAGTRSGDFSTQLASVIAGTSDYTVAQGYADVHADMWATLYAGSPSGLSSSSFSVSALQGYQPQGTGTYRSDGTGPRVAQISATGLDHAWPGGTGSGFTMGFVNPQGVDYAWFLADFFTQNARRGPPFGGGGGPTGDTGSPGGPTGDSGGDTGTPPDSGDTGVTDTGSGGGCDDWVATATDTVNGHLSRYASYPGGWGAADQTYVSLYFEHGLYTSFTLYQAEASDWYADPANVPPRTCP